MSGAAQSRVRIPYLAWALGVAAGLVDAVAMTQFVARALPFAICLYGFAGVLIFALARAVFTLALPPERATRVALAVEAFTLAFLFAAFAVTTATSGFLVSRTGQLVGLVLALVLCAALGAGVARSWRPGRAGLAWKTPLAVALALWPALWLSALARPAPGEGRGLILVSMDAARGDRVSALGYARPTTPHVDRLVERGLSFTHAVVQCPASGPSHATLLTGLPPLAHQVVANADLLAPEVLTVAERLREAGFATAGFADNFYIDARYGFDQGFDTWVNESRAASVSTWSAVHLVRTTVAYRVFHRLSRKPGEKNRDSIAGALQWLRHRPAGDFFLFLHVMDPHAPYDAPEAIRDRFYQPEGARVRDTVELRSRLVESTDVEQAALSDLYDASIALADQKVGELVAGLEAVGLFENSLIVITADHGEILDENGPVFDHGLPGQGNLHVPLVISGGLAPGAPGQRVTATVTNTSWVATAFDVLGLEYVEQGTQTPVGPCPWTRPTFSPCSASPA